MSSGIYLASGFLYLNLGSHMMFVLKNRLKAQGIPGDKTQKIITDLVNAIFKLNFVKTVTTSQEPIALPTLKEIFRKLAHSSIMKLDNASMEKLLYLIIMTVKKQVFLASSPLELYSITLGNIQILHKYCKGGSSEDLLEGITNHFVETASQYSFIQYYELRQFLLSIFQPYQTKVVNFAESGLQTQKGKLIFVRRNAHNNQPLGEGVNHPTLKLSNSKQNKIFLLLGEWKLWKTSLALDHAHQYEKQSQKRQEQNDIQAYAKEKSVNDLFSFEEESLNNFEIRLDLFEYNKEESRKQHKKQLVKSIIAPVNKQSEPQKDMMEQFAKQIQSVQMGNNELDLLDLMDI